MSAPSMTFNAEAGLLSSQSLAASGTVTFDIDISTKWEQLIQCKGAGGGSVAGTNGLRIEAFNRMGTSPTNDTEPTYARDITMAASTTKYWTFRLPTGKWRVKFTNLDASNAITVEATSATIDSVS